MDRAAFFAALRSRANTLFGASLSQSQVTNIDRLLDAGQAAGWPLKWMAYGLATVYGECGRNMAPVREGFAKTDEGARRAVNNLARKRGPKSAVARYAQPTGPHGHVYYGRGYVQLTWIDNYAAAGRALNIDLVKEPDLALDPAIAAKILIWGMEGGHFTGKRLSDYSDYLPMRRIINGMDKAEKFATWAGHFETALRAGGYGLVKAAPPPKAAPMPPAPPLPVQKPKAPDAIVRLVEDADKPISTTNIAAGIGTASGAVAIANQAAEAVQGAQDALDTLMSVGPWMLLLIVILGAGWWIWKERKAKQRLGAEARAHV